jgi:tetratricopeptide (TPR) repeat protein
MWPWSNALVRSAIIGLSGTACASHPGRAPSSPSSHSSRVVTLPRTVITPQSGASIDELYDAATRDLLAGRLQQAAAAFERIFSLEPDGRLAPHALLQAGSALDQAGELDAAVARYEQLARRFPSHELAREALVRSVRLLAFLEQWSAALADADILLARETTLSPYESIVAYSGKALGLIAAGDLTSAEYYIEKGRSVIDDRRLDAAGRVSRDLAQLYFALGELRRLRAEQIHLNPPPADFAGALERRCQLLLDAQSAYSDSMRAYDAHWSAMAGYRVGELYHKLHAELMAVPAPKSAHNEARRLLFEGAMRLRYSILLTKALTMMQHTLDMARRTGERSQWVVRSQAARDEIEQGIRAENAALDRLPYTRAQLQAALDDLAKSKRSAPGSSGQP